MATKKKTTTKTSRSTASRRTSAKQKKENQELKDIILAVILLAITLVAYRRMGIVGEMLNNGLRFLLGRFYYLVVGVVILQIIITLINRYSGNTLSRNPLAIVLLILGFLLLVSLIDTPKSLHGTEIYLNYVDDVMAYFSSNPAEAIGGGLIGALLLTATTLLVDRTGTIVILVADAVIVLLLLVSLNVYKQAFHTIVEYFSTNAEDEDDLVEDDVPEEEITPRGETPKKKHIALLGMKKKPEPEPVPVPVRTPQTTTMANIRIDDHVAEPEPEPVKPQPKAVSCVFMNVDDLYDSMHTPEPEPVPVNLFEPEPEPEQLELFEDTTVGGPEEKQETLSLDDTAVAETRRVQKPYHLPKTNLLDPVPPVSRQDDNQRVAAEKGELLIQVLQNFDIRADLVDTHIGPAVTKYEIRPQVGVKVSRILSLADDIKMQLAVKDVRIEAPIPGHNAVGIEIPNVKATPVKMKDLILHMPQKDKDQPLLIFLGKDLMGDVITCRLDRMPHLLVAGATGSGKSVCMNSIIVSILMRSKPDEVKLLLVDPKKVEFTPFKNIPHLIGPVINDPQQANNALKVIVRIMEERYNIFSRTGVRNIQGYNEKVEDGSINADKTPEQPKEKKMPYIVVIIDELADLMMVAGKEVEGSIQRITQLARAAGIHLIVATQRPSTDVITGIIKANIPSRIAFSVSSGIDSRTILDHVGAERLLGNGDMLYLPIGESAALRVQGAYVTDDEVKRITEYVAAQAVPMFDDAFIMLSGVEGNAGTAVMEADEDPMYEEVKKYVIEKQKASTSLLQRAFGIGYNRAARMIDVLESKGVIGPQQGSKPREVFIKPEEEQ